VGLFSPGVVEPMRGIGGGFKNIWGIVFFLII